jgi:proline iminopeptidase
MIKTIRPVMIRCENDSTRKLAIKKVILQLTLCTLFILISLSAFAQPVTNGKVAREGFDLHYSVIGNNGPYILLLSGGPGSSVEFLRPVADSLSKFGRCILLEQRGTGRSVLQKIDSITINMNAYVQDIEALRKHLGVKQFIIIGESWGSLLSFLYAGSYDKNVKGIISLTTGLITSEYADVFDDNFRMRLLPHEKEIRDLWREKLRNPAVLKDSSAFIKAHYMRDAAGMPAYYYNRQLGLKAAMELKPTEFNYYVGPAFFKAHPNFDIRPLLKNITAPVLLMQGRQDLAGEANVYEAHLLMKNSVLKFFNRCGHFPLEEKPSEAWPILIEFLKTKLL